MITATVADVPGVRESMLALYEAHEKWLKTPETVEDSTEKDAAHDVWYQAEEEFYALVDAIAERFQIAKNTPIVV